MQENIDEEQRQAALIKARREAQERQELQRQYQILNEAKRILEKSKKLSHALMEYNYNKNRELVLLPDRIAWADCLPFLLDNQS